MVVVDRLGICSRTCHSLDHFVTRPVGSAAEADMQYSATHVVSVVQIMYASGSVVDRSTISYRTVALAEVYNSDRVMRCGDPPRVVGMGLFPAPRWINDQGVRSYDETHHNSLEFAPVGVLWLHRDRLLSNICDADSTG